MLIVDTGFDMGHPDFQFNSAFLDYPQNNPTNPCKTGPPTTCYYESPYHGSSILGLVMGLQNGQASVGTAPSPNGAPTIAKVTFDLGNGLPTFDVKDMSDAVLALSQQNLGGRAPIGVTAVVFNDTTTSKWPTLHDAYRTAYNTDRVLWIAGASQDVAGSPVSVPGAFSDVVVAVGSVWPQNGQLVRSPYSPIDPRIELVGPGGGPGMGMPASWNRANGGPTANLAGNSVAAAIVAGVARLAAQAHPDWDGPTLRFWLQNTARKLGNQSASEYGYGMPDAVCLIAMNTSCTFSVNIAGPTPIGDNWQHTWTANVTNTGTNHTYSYYWEQSPDGVGYWSHVGTNASTFTTSYSGNGRSWVYLRVTVTEAGHSAISPNFPIQLVFCLNGKPYPTC